MAASVAPPATTPITVIPPAKRDVTFHLTPFAPGLNATPVGDRRRTYTVLNRRPGQALNALLRKLEIDADLVEVSPAINGEPVIHPVGLPHEPWAFVWEGLALTELITALAGLRALSERSQ